VLLQPMFIICASHTNRMICRICTCGCSHS